MQKKSFSEEEFRNISKKIIPVLDELKEIVKENGAEDDIRVYISKDYTSVEGTGLKGWEIHNYSGEYEMKYERRVPFKKSEDGENNQ